jgi:hypothetical protein
MLLAAAWRTSRAQEYFVVSLHLNARAAFVSQRNCWCGALANPTAYIFTISAGADVNAIGS